MWTYRLKKDPTKTVTIRDENLKSLLEREGFELFNEIKKNIEVKKEVIKNIEVEAIETLLKGNFMKMKYRLSEYIEEADKKLIYDTALNLIDSLSVKKIEFVSELCGKILINK
jgi:hypothetical protein